MSLFKRGDTKVKIESNGAQRAKKVYRKGFKTFKKSKNIAAIDFGTKNCSLAYITENDTANMMKTGVPKLPLNGTFLRVPTAILFNPEGNVVAFGHDAKRMYGNLRDTDYSRYFYFEEIKMNLHHEQEISRKMQVCASNGKKCYLVDVIAQILRHLKTTFIEGHLRPSGHSFQASDFDWIITVPAIWRARGKQMMREAGYKAGLCSRETCGRLKISSAQPLDPLQETAPDKLTLALEPESASLYCHQMLKRGLVASHCKPMSSRVVPQSYLIVDIGGGTVDISSHKIVSVRDGTQSFPVVEELYQSVGNGSGGAQVNKEFLKFLGNLTGDLSLAMYVNTPDPELNAINQFELDEVVNVTFEEQKQAFGRLEKSSHRDIVVRLPPSFLDIYRDKIKDHLETEGTLKEQVTLERRSLRLSIKQMKDFFAPVVKEILRLLRDHLERLSETIQVIYLVGGFGGCPYLYTKISELVGSTHQIIVPPNPELAVVEGAALFHYNSSFIQTRRADATYGKSVIRPFDKFLHDRRHRIISTTGKELCQNIFQTIIEVGEVINPNFVYMCTAIPVSSEQKNMHIEIFSSLNHARDIWYTQSSEVVKIGELVVDLQFSLAASSQEDREVEFTFDFSHTEIKVVGFEKVSQLQVKTVIDFLSSHITA